MGRKLAVELRLAYHSVWTVPLWGGLISWGLLIARQKDQASWAEQAAGSAAVLACLLSNDAGVVAAALCVSLLWCSAALKIPPAETAGGIH